MAVDERLLLLLLVILLNSLPPVAIATLSRRWQGIIALCWRRFLRVATHAGGSDSLPHVARERSDARSDVDLHGFRCHERPATPSFFPARHICGVL